MSVGFKLILVAISVGTLAYMIRKIRKSQAQIIDMSFWVLFSLALIVIALFPEIAAIISEILGIASSINFVFLAVVFLLLVELFVLAVKVSKLESKLVDLAGEIAIQNEGKNE